MFIMFNLLVGTTPFCMTIRNQATLRKEGYRGKTRGVMKALKMSVIHAVTFILSWTPYTVMATW